MTLRSVRGLPSSLSTLPFSPLVCIWNDLEIRYSHKKILLLQLVRNNLRQHPDHFFAHSSSNPPTYTPHNQFEPPPFRNQQFTLPDNPKSGRCIFCEDRSKSHPSNACVTSCYSNGTPCHLIKQEPNGTRASRSGKHYCFAWNGPSSCTQIQIPCCKGEHFCTLCGSTGHNAQLCDAP